MPNMSYCRFENTARDLADCEQALDALMNPSEEKVEPLSASELQAAKRLVNSCYDILSMLADHAGTDLGDVNYGSDLADELDEINEETDGE